MLYELTTRVIAALEPKPIPHSGIALRELGPRIWRADRWIRLAGGVRLPLAMLVVGGPDRQLLLYAPVALDDNVEASLDGLGNVRWIVAPNRHHTSFVAPYLQRYPNAAAYVAEAPPGFDSWLAFKTVAVRDGFTEVCAYHTASQTLMVGDLAFNLLAGPHILRWTMRLNGAWRRFGPTRMQRKVLFRNPDALADFYRWAMARPFTRVCVAHGAVLDRDAREAFYQAFHGFSS